MITIDDLDSCKMVYSSLQKLLKAYNFSRLVPVIENFISSVEKLQESKLIPTAEQKEISYMLEQVKALQKIVDRIVLQTTSITSTSVKEEKTRDLIQHSAIYMSPDTPPKLSEEDKNILNICLQNYQPPTRAGIVQPTTPGFCLTM